MPLAVSNAGLSMLHTFAVMNDIFDGSGFKKNVPHKNFCD